MRTMHEDDQRRYKIGILEVQGAFLEHKMALQAAASQLANEVSLDVIGVRNTSHITSDLDGLILPGGESTAISLFLKRNNMVDALADWIRHRKHVTWGTCAGMILLTKYTEHQKELGDQDPLGIINAVVARNYFGRQVDSFEAVLKITDPDLQGRGSSTDHEDFTGVFIRAPAIIRTTGPNIKILSTLAAVNKHDTVIVACRQENVFVTAFHPELTDDHRWHRYFLRMIQNIA